MNDGRREFPSAAAAHGIRAWLDDRIAEIERGAMSAARTALEDPGSRFHFDLSDVPLSALARIDGFVDTAAEALADHAPDSATLLLHEARGVVSRP